MTNWLESLLASSNFWDSLVVNIISELAALPIITLIVVFVVRRSERSATGSARGIMINQAHFVLERFFHAKAEQSRAMWMAELDLLAITNAFATTSKQQLAFNNLRTSLKILHVERRLSEWKEEVFLGRYRECVLAFGLGTKVADWKVAEMKAAISTFRATIEADEAQRSSFS